MRSIRRVSASWLTLMLSAATAGTVNPERSIRAICRKSELRRQMEAIAAELRELSACTGRASCSTLTEPGQDPRHLGTVEPLWTLFDLTPGGRPDRDEQIEYPCCPPSDERSR